MKNFRIWVIIATVFQFLTGFIHSLSFFVEPQPANDTEKQLIELFSNYKQDMGSGYHRSMEELWISVSACFTLLFFFGGLINWYLLKKKVSRELMSGMLRIQIFIFGTCFVAMLVFAFLPPIVLAGLTFLFILIGGISVTSSKSA